jgi:histidyl-tRNA synthetase
MGDRQARRAGHGRGGGRYDPLIEQLGGKPTAACGWAMGIERMLELLKEEDLAPEQEGVDVYVVHQGEAAREQAFIAAERLRDTGLDVIFTAAPTARRRASSRR